uniref:(northern house mosquito) hypothetical protein n=1 Tax=Culex pipiens TaxID=7175 RepID=A0A8D8DF21_CULPI
MVLRVRVSSTLSVAFWSPFSSTTRPRLLRYLMSPWVSSQALSDSVRYSFSKPGRSSLYWSKTYESSRKSNDFSSCWLVKISRSRSAWDTDEKRALQLAALVSQPSSA